MNTIEKETSLDSCRTLLRFLRFTTGVNAEAVRNAILQDLLWKATFLRDQSRAVVLAEGLFEVLHERAKGLLSEDSLGIRQLSDLPALRRESADIGIVTIIDEEFDAVRAALGNMNEMPIHRDGVDYWTASVARTGKRQLRAVILKIGEAGNVGAALKVQQFAGHFSVGVLILVGIAAGDRQKLALGDAVIVDKVHSYESVRSERKIRRGKKGRTRERPRPIVLALRENVKRDVTRLDSGAFRNLFNGIRDSLGRSSFPKSESFGKPKLRRGTAAAGERLIADDSLQDLKERRDDLIRVVDMEDSGFAQAAELVGIDWCIFRGVSDFGTLAKAKRDSWHLAGSAAAAAAMLAFVKYCHRPVDERAF